MLGQSQGLDGWHASPSTLPAEALRIASTDLEAVVTRRFDFTDRCRSSRHGTDFGFVPDPLRYSATSNHRSSSGLGPSTGFSGGAYAADASVWAHGSGRRQPAARQPLG